MSFWDFVSDMGERPLGYSIERTDNNGDYEPSNCIWAGRDTQMMNRSVTIHVDVAGEVLTTAEIFARYGTPPKRVKWRVNRGGLTGRQIVGLDPMPPVTKPPTENMRANWAEKKAATHCINGHEYTPETTLIDRHGWRKCRICHNARRAGPNRKNRKRPPPKDGWG